MNLSSRVVAPNPRAALSKGRQPGEGRDLVRRRGHRLRRLLAVIALLSLGSISALASSTASASASSNFSNHTSGVWWFWSSNFPYSFSEHASAGGIYTVECNPGCTYEWDYVTVDGLSMDVSNGQANWLPPTPIYIAEWLDYYQSGYNFVNSWAGQYYVNCIASIYDSYQCLGDHPDYSYYVPMHVKHTYEGWTMNGCCTDQASYWIV
jgi:hypothetical protein